ncbi:MAG: YafY family transcriptional regulator [Alphaproteobacteria bacterium]|nr:YafY family transcriptional regulator [Alphaproteobacteria bacterium]
MRKIDRLFEIVQLLRGRRLRTAQYLAGQIGVSTRTIYRDIQGLTASGVPIEGERGVGYLIQQPIELPPLHFTPLELQTIKFGLDFAKAAADPEMENAAQEVLLKINDVLPMSVLEENAMPLMRVYFKTSDKDKAIISKIRLAMVERFKLKLDYVNADDESSQRVVRPLGLEYWGKIWTLTTWCELRDDFRVFRLDRILNCDILDEVFAAERGKKFEDYLESVNEKSRS